MNIVQVAFPIPIYSLFDYIVPDNMDPVIGGRVSVTFGKTKKIGIVVSLCSNSNILKHKLKIIENVLDTKSLFNPSIWKTLNWASVYYFCPLGMILFYSLPKFLRKGHHTILLSKWMITNKGKNISLDQYKYSVQQKKALKILYNNSIYANIKNAYTIQHRTFCALQKKGLCKLIQNINNIEWPNDFINLNNKLILNNEQMIAFNSIHNKIMQYKTWLLAGITSSGKTEVYLQVIEEILKKGKQVLFLIPEINLIPQTTDRLRKRFRVPIDTLHSGISNKEKFNIWLRISQGHTAIVIGTRSALFAPFVKLGVIIIDEEHDNSYKQQHKWNYHARNLAIFLAQTENIPVILGSATPSIETLHNVKIGKYYQLNLNNKATSYKNSIVQQLIDLKGMKLKGCLTSILIQKIDQHLHDNNQVLLFLNRRGYAPLIVCHKCGWIAECNHCNKYYTLHYQYQYRLLCHKCNSKKNIPNQCPKCNSIQILPFGVGTEQLEQQLSCLFPHVPVSRIDRDTTHLKGSLETHLDNINRGGARILIGTQMLAKGHHFPNITLVALLNVDGALFSLDFRATENFAQLYIQVSGRTGRSRKRSEVVLQTYYPEHPILETLLHKGYYAFAKQVLIERKLLFLPPWTKHAIFKAEDTNNKYASKFLYQLRDILENNRYKDEFLCVIGPMPALQSKIKGYWRWQLLVQHSSYKILHIILKNSLIAINNLTISNKIKWMLDIDPIEI